MPKLSLRDTAFALDHPSPEPWSLKASAKVPADPPLPRSNGTISVRRMAKRFSGAGGALRALSQSNKNVWKHVKRDVVVRELRNRLRDPMIIRQNPTGFAGRSRSSSNWRAVVRVVMCSRRRSCWKQVSSYVLRGA
jgi:hypothetical protein